MKQAIRATSSRAWYLDFLRIAAMLFIVLLHVTPLAQTEYGAPEWTALAVISALCRWCVPVYFMISGALFLSPRKPLDTRRLFKVNIARMLCSFFAWSALYALVYCIASGKGKWTFLNQFFRGHYHMWFILSIIALYWITPLLRMITQSRKATEYLLAASLVFSILPARLFGFIQLFDLPHSDVLQSLQALYAQMNPYRALSSVFFFVLGHYLHDYPFSRNLQRFLIASGIAGIAATIPLTLWHSAASGASSSYFVDSTSLNILAASVGIFLLFRQAADNVRLSERAQSAVLLVSGCTYGVYLLHPLLIERLLPAFPQNPVLLIAAVLLSSAVVFVLSLAVTALIRRIPVLGRYIV